MRFCLIQIYCSCHYYGQEVSFSCTVSLNLRDPFFFFPVNSGVTLIFLWELVLCPYSHGVLSLWGRARWEGKSRVWFLHELIISCLILTYHLVYLEASIGFHVYRTNDRIWLVWLLKRLRDLAGRSKQCRTHCKPLNSNAILLITFHLT